MNADKRARLAKVKKKLLDSGMTKKRKFVDIKCVVCEKDNHVRTNIPEAYNAHVRATYVCPICK